jgi:hypothetical protein
MYRYANHCNAGSTQAADAALLPLLLPLLLMVLPRVDKIRSWKDRSAPQ